VWIKISLIQGGLRGVKGASNTTAKQCDKVEVTIYVFHQTTIRIKYSRRPSKTTRWHTFCLHKRATAVKSHQKKQTEPTIDLPDDYFYLIFRRRMWYKNKLSRQLVLHG
jgi:hypothetical protein